MNEKIQILIYEKDENLGSLLQEYLQMSEYEVALFNDTDTAYKAFSNGGYALCLLDIEADKPEELELGRMVKAEKEDVSVIFMSAKPEISFVLAAYRAGADDFMRKPFILEELQARIHAILRRTKGERSKETTYYQIGKYFFDTRKRTLTIDENIINLTTKECALLRLLCEHANEVIERNYILRAVWKSDSYFSARSMDVYITKIRKLLKDDQELCVVNIHGHGYKLVTRKSEM